MKKIFSAFLPAICLFICPIEAQNVSSPPSPNPQANSEEGIIFFTPPANWMLANPSVLPASVKTMVVGKGPSAFPPSLNLSWEPFKATLKQYLKIVKNINAAQGYDWKDLGTIQTQAGTGSLSQVDTKTEWGDVRLMHVILVKNGYVYILTASALKDEFSIFYKEFFSAMRSLRIVKDVYEMVPNSQRNQLKTAVNKLVTQWQTLLNERQKQAPQMNWDQLQENLFNSGEFQNTLWNPFKEMLKQKYNLLENEWHSMFLQKLEDQLFNQKPNS